ncbi:hypothetical protein K492DRAFT_122009 [Lichtheimia hyalospora FSU 10163]|nr:hypothetical protein K492DRAFT_122009 [Lichtheimia hyalospora FSU 10163]
MDCISSLSNIDSYVRYLGSQVNGWQPSDGYGAALRIHAIEQSVEGRIEEGTSICDLGGQVSASHADTILNELDTVVPDIESALGEVVQRKSAFDSVPLVTPLVTRDIQNLFAKTYALENKLLADMPNSRKQRVTGYINRINSAFSAAYRTYGLY